MAHIRIEAKTVVGFTDHLYLVFVNDAGAEFVIRGGPTDNFPNFGPIDVEVGFKMIDSEDARPIEDRELLYGSRVLDLGDRDANDVWTSMLQAASLIGEANIGYGTQNSNSTVASVLFTVGIDVNGVLPDVPGIDSFPGVNNDLLNDYERIFLSEHTSSEIDILRGGDLDDIFVLGSGNDQLHTGEGDDILIGDKGADLLDGGDGNDTADYSGTLGNADSSGTQGITADIAVNFDAEVTASVIDNWGATDTLISIESITGTEFADRFALTGPAVAIAAGIGILDAGESPVELGDTIDFSDVSSVNGLIISLDEGLPRQRHKQLWQLFG